MSSSWCTAFCCSASDYFSVGECGFQLVQLATQSIDFVAQIGQALEERAGAGEVSGIDGGRSHEGLAIGTGAVDAGLRTDLHTIGQLQ